MIKGDICENSEEFPDDYKGNHQRIDEHTKNWPKYKEVEWRFKYGCWEVDWSSWIGL